MISAGDSRPYGPWRKRIGWLLLLWLLGVGVLGGVAVVLKLVMYFAGLTR